MAKKDANNYGTRDQTEHQAEHQDESASDAKQSKYPGAKQPADWDRGDRQEQFATELEAIDEKAAAAFREGKNLLDDKVCENAGERKEHLSSYMNAFNNSFDRDKITPGERWEAAKDVSQAVFQPMYEETELIEAKNDEKFSPELYKALEKEGISDYWVNEATGQLEFNVTSTQQASRIAKMSKQEIRMLEGSSKGEGRRGAGRGPERPGKIRPAGREPGKIRPGPLGQQGQPRHRPRAHELHHGERRQVRERREGSVRRGNDPRKPERNGPPDSPKTAGIHERTHLVRDLPDHRGLDAGQPG